ncbi:sensor histidine kinase (plasmid) [Anabaena sp. FACHB-709]|uniref:histidine kinase n=2 Tax=Nostocaceae TaxID=1162 RepID=A0A1Z4KUI4_ANAVA|nr:MULTISPECIES: HAMP domain-containing sensor histidine kinase [Nostocaceae]BAY72604.1 histidine kinase-like ATPase [Trichormus variabilis NIES-23]MBD2174192.1 HAMP domain-containing histidine kinase [Anabaena cylindrica FACHB-318]MBD2265981.1 HAMP domain-containing histidine kinase [Anabaena sp. FACHB-709]MBD2275486.1 HAMP domain-containing histidine kinase [Nostoc sp. PCC 7120 = FACHB-418]MBD2286312.1 HAMP domain-containing histidine kinase [Anabaena cylindrica FACHB-170]
MQQEVLSKQLDILALLHDVSNSLKGISLIANQLIDGAYGYSLEEIRPFLLALRDTNDRGMNLLEANKVSGEVKPVALAQFDMLSFLQKTSSLFQPIAQYHSLKMHYETQSSYKHGTQVRGDSISIDRMLCNIVTNAIKYTRRGDIFLRLLNQEDDLVIEIEDTGIGIATDQLSNIFIPLWRSPTVGGTPSPNSNLLHQSGMGLGLYIALCVAHAHGLSMRVDSVVKQGTKFTIIFPYKDDGIYGVDGMMPPKSPRRQDALPI